MEPFVAIAGMLGPQLQHSQIAVCWPGPALLRRERAWIETRGDPRHLALWTFDKRMTLRFSDFRHLCRHFVTALRAMGFVSIVAQVEELLSAGVVFLSKHFLVRFVHLLVASVTSI